MDNITVDLGADPAAERLRGERAILIGSQGGERITAEEVALRLDTINYEVTCALTPRVPRVYHRDGAPIEETRAAAARPTGGREPIRIGQAERGPGGGSRGARGQAGLARGRSHTRPCARPLDPGSRLVVDGDPGRGRAGGGARRRATRRALPCPRSSGHGGSWRATHSWQLDVEPLRGGSLEADLALRDFTVNAIAEPIEGGAPIDPLGGLADLAARRLRMAGPRAFAEDPLRVLRLARMAVELGLEPEPQTAAQRPCSGRRRFGACRPSGCSWSCAGSSPRRGRRGALS